MSENVTSFPEAPARSDTESGLVYLLQALPELHSAAELRPGLELLAERMRRVVPYDNLALLLLDDRGRELGFELAIGYAEGVAKHWRFGLGQGIVGTVAQTGEPIHVDDVEGDPRYLAAAPGTRAELAVPLQVKGRVIGVLDVGSLEPAAFTGDHARMVTLLADCLATAIDGRRLYDNLREQTRSLSVLHEANRELTSVLDRRRVLERVAERLESLIRYDIFSVFLWNEQQRQLEPWVWVRGEEIKTGQRAMALGEGIAGTAAALRQLVRVPNVCLDPRFVACDSELPVRSEIALPLVFEDRLVGVLNLESFEYDAFRSEHEQLLSTLGSSLAIALTNAEMYETLKQNQRSLDEDLSTARSVQRQLLPRVTPWIQGVEIAVESEPARHLGGDFYDFLRYGEDRIAIAVGDVAGKATSAALYAALTVGILREFASNSHPSPGQMLSYLNDKLVEREIVRRFVALTFAVFDASTGVLSLANAGLPYPVLVRRRRAQELELGGVPLGQLRQPEYAELELRLEPGDTVVFASDGIAEARDAQGHEFGSERTLSVLERLVGGSSDGTARGLVQAVSRFAAGRPASDDRTVVVLRKCEGDCGCD